MKQIIILSVLSLASAAKLDKVYLPPHSQSSSGASAGLQTPFSQGSNQNNQGSNQYNQGSSQYNQGSSQYNQGSNQYNQGSSQYNQGSSQYNQGPSQYNQESSGSNGVEILRYDNEITDDGYRYAYETSDGTKAEQEGRVLPGSAPEEGSLQVSGSYSYIGDDGQTYSITYTADENGYQAQGSHLPTPPPIPEAILRSLQLTAGKGGQYDSKKSSYDADNGY